MRPFAAILVFLALSSCAADVPQADHQTEWRDVLQRKRAAIATQASAMHKQAYADSLAAFVQKHPSHDRAREVYQRMQLEFADELMTLGRFEDAMRFYRAVLARDPSSVAAQAGVADAAERLAISREKLERLEKGMTHGEVAGLLGRPIPGWSVKKQHRDLTVEAWYYKTTAGGIAGVYFREGEVIGAELNSEAPLGL
jgi:tetratricopeptide (TPR) repeat protein